MSNDVRQASDLLRSQLGRAAESERFRVEHDETPAVRNARRGARGVIEDLCGVSGAAGPARVEDSYGAVVWK
jgi:hypothetical protein